MYDKHQVSSRVWGLMVFVSTEVGHALVQVCKRSRRHSVLYVTAAHFLGVGAKALHSPLCA